MTQHLKDLKDRLKVLNDNLTVELAGDNNKLYIDDLTGSIQAVENQIKFLEKNPNGITQVLPNG